ncbi:cytochrome o ubiquinol oxidase subunit IV [uncultured Brevundimonas sp.]|uniref:cytochrome o ubiquinol oxidase subunit IV n=1 Tax=uncultured Brevundimonas sp. TaxID=213418 RepID=UPI0026204573|nr:cytochrome o ubiquinol oxidase subunit IV [uncultured Brevundimonas sp.]
MSGHDTHNEHHDDHHEAEGYHGSYRDYLIGFIASVVLTAIPFALVMTGVLPPQTTALTIVAFAAVQMVVHMIYFLHLHPKSEGGWNMLAIIFTIVVVAIAVGGSIWVMWHMNTNMMPVHQMPSFG